MKIAGVKIETVVLEVLQEWDKKERGWWYGYSRLIKDVKKKAGKEIPLSKIIEALRGLRKQELVRVGPIFREDTGKLNGRGYFYNESKTIRQMKTILLSLFLSLFVSLADGQKLYRYNHSDTLVELITAPYFLSEKLVYFDSSFIKVFESGYSQFKIGRVCQEIGCIGEFSETGKTQSGWWQFENKIILCYLTGMENGRFKTELLIYRYDQKIRKFVLLL